MQEGRQGGGEKVDHGVQQRLDPFVPEGRAQEHREDAAGQDPEPERAPQPGGGDILVLQEIGEDGVVEIGGRLGNGIPALAGRVQQVRRHENPADRPPLVPFAKGNQLPGKEVDHPAEAGFFAHRELEEHRPGLELLFHLAQGAPQVGADPVHLVDEADAGDPVAVRLAPDRFALGLDPLHGAEDGHCAVEDPEAPFHFNGEIDVSGRVHQVEPVVVPGADGGGGGDGDSPLLLLGHPVHDRFAVVDFPHLVGFTSVEEDAFGHRGLAGVDVGDDADGADLVEGGGPWDLRDANCPTV